MTCDEWSERNGIQRRGEEVVYHRVSAICTFHVTDIVVNTSLRFAIPTEQGRIAGILVHLEVR